MSPTQAAGYKVRIPTLTLFLHTPSVNKFCFSIARGLSRVKMLVKEENGYGILFFMFFVYFIEDGD